MREMMEWVRYSNSIGFSFQGRARRREYWWNALFWGLVSMALFFGTMILGMVFSVTGFAGDIQDSNLAFATTMGLMFVGYAVMLIIIFWKIMPIAIRRLHDRGLSGWIYLLLMVISCFCGLGSIVMIVLLCLDSQPGSNQYGPNPKENCGMQPLV